ncbi:hypothetical protein PSQ90_14470 [Devosia rhodophyticola]|uniref:Uncharacterized protein n=1 Tax=Devosia rhodophyticola TaxID=3026423 RepID=A0ABY7YVY6_9HYPH|nr:hypothetical protein [Devosia rhodophyticola]WDR05471.1 hypothetical protein PSQ90_14470 [Devosia rhodophyticola]
MEKNAINQNTDVNFGDGVNVSMKTVQDIYNKITGRTEQITKSYDISHIADFSDLEQLHEKITQMCEQYNIISRNENIEVFYNDKHKQTISSFSRFKIHDKSYGSPTENVRIRYNFMILLPQTQSPQSYILDINVHSRSALIERSHREIGVPSSIWSMITTSTGFTKISFVDYSVARNFQNVIDGWFETLDASPENKIVSFLQKYSFLSAPLFKIAMSGTYLFGTWASFNSNRTAELSSNSSFLHAIVMIFGGAMILWVAGQEIGKIFERYIDRILPISCLQINKGDFRMLDSHRKKNRHSFLIASLSVVVAIAINVASSVFIQYLGL